MKCQALFYTKKWRKILKCASSAAVVAGDLSLFMKDVKIITLVLSHFVVTAWLRNLHLLHVCLGAAVDQTSFYLSVGPTV